MQKKAIFLEPQNKEVPKKIKIQNELSDKLMLSHGPINNLQINQENKIKKNDEHK